LLGEASGGGGGDGDDDGGDWSERWSVDTPASIRSARYIEITGTGNQARKGQPKPMQQNREEDIYVPVWSIHIEFALSPSICPTGSFFPVSKIARDQRTAWRGIQNT